MKRNKTNHRAGKSGTSPYRRQGKRPFEYSEAYYKWFRNIAGRPAMSDKRA